jgi:hypothetical protein
MLLVATVKSSAPIPEGTVLHLEVDGLPLVTGAQVLRLDTNGLAARYDVDKKTAERWAVLGCVPGYKVGGKWFFNVADLERLEADHKTRVTAALPGAIRNRAMGRPVRLKCAERRPGMERPQHEEREAA